MTDQQKLSQSLAQLSEAIRKIKANETEEDDLEANS